MSGIPSPAPQLEDLVPYDPKYLPARVYLNANENPYGVPDAVINDIKEGLCAHDLNRYPNPLADELRGDLAAYHGVQVQNVLLGNGGDELLFDILLAYGGPGRKMLTCTPAFSVYNGYAELTKTEVVDIKRDECGRVRTGDVIERVAQGDIDIVMLASPNNPTGDCLDIDFWQELLAASDTLVIADQAYMEFADAKYDALKLFDANENLAILRTFSKAFALAGLRLGYLLAHKGIITELCKVRQPYSVDKVSAMAGRSALKHADYMRRAVADVRAQREGFLAYLADAGIDAYPSEANYVFLPNGDAHGIWQRLYDNHGILVRDFGFGLRITIGTAGEMDELKEALKCELRS
jgi:histidinol-phosphate aminotransferase